MTTGRMLHDLLADDELQAERDAIDEAFIDYGRSQYEYGVLGARRRCRPHRTTAREGGTAMTTEHDELHAEREAVWVLGQFRLHLTEVPPFSEALTALIEKAKLIGARDALLAYGKKYEPSGPHGAFIEYTIRHAIGTRSL